jgi:hypothetical protein
MGFTMASWLLIGAYFVSIVLYVWFRPSWRRIGPSLLDSFVIGQILYAVGSISVWLFTSYSHASDVMWIGITSAAVGNLSAAACSFALRDRIAALDFAGWSNDLVAMPADRFAIKAGLLCCILVTGWFLAQMFMHDHIRNLLIATVQGDPRSYTTVRLVMASGTEGYFAPGYVKQFRDVLVPILCAAAIFCHGTFRGRALLVSALALAIAGIFVAGLRMSIVQVALTLAFAVFYDYRIKSPHYRLVPIGAAGAIFCALLVSVMVMTSLLGRPEMGSPVELPQATVTEQQRPLPVERPAPSIQSMPREEPPHKAAPTQVPVPKPAPTQPPEAGTTAEDLSSDKKPAFVVLAIIRSIVERSVMAVPQENTLTYDTWGRESPTYGVGWLNDLAGILPRTQFGLSNRLAGQDNISGSTLAASPLGFAADSFYNWGYAGPLIFSALCALGFLLLDVVLTESRSALLYAAKTFIFFSIPTIYSPFLFVLYGGAVVLGLMCYVALAKRMLASGR